MATGCGGLGFTPRSVRGVAAGAQPEVRIHLPPAANDANSIIVTALCESLENRRTIDEIDSTPTAKGPVGAPVRRPQFEQGLFERSVLFWRLNLGCAMGIAVDRDFTIV